MNAQLANEQFVAELMEKMTIEEKVGQVIMGDLDFVSPSDLKNYPLGGILNGGNTSPRGKLRASPEEWKSLAQEFYEVSTTRGGVEHTCSLGHRCRSWFTAMSLEQLSFLTMLVWEQQIIHIYWKK